MEQKQVKPRKPRAKKIEKVAKPRYHYYDEKKEHLHTLDMKPLFGTSTVCKIIGNGGAFSWWASGKAVEKFGWVKKADLRKVSSYEAYENAIARFGAAADALNVLRSLTPTMYLEHLDAAYRAHQDSKQDSAEKGTDMHAELELYVKECIHKNEGKPLAYTGEHPQVQSFSKWSVEKVKRFIWSEAHCYSEKLWVGGISDCGAEMKDGEIALIDFKSSKEAYFSAFVQCAGYAIQIEENGLINADGTLSMKLEKPVSVLMVVPFGAEDVTPRVRFDVAEKKKDFEAAVRLHKSNEAMN